MRVDINKLLFSCWNRINTFKLRSSFASLNSNRKPLHSHQCQRYLYISVQQTPNEESRIFTPEKIPSLPISVPSKPLWFPTQQSCEGVSPLAEKLFQIDGVHKIMINKASFTVTKKHDIPWQTVQTAVILALNKCLSNGIRYQTIEERKIEEIADNNYSFKNNENEEHDDDDDDLESCIKEVLAKRVSPIIESDGGSINMKKFDLENGIVWVQMLGACDGCPSSNLTIKDHIERMLSFYFLEVKEVRLWNDEVDSFSDATQNKREKSL